MPSHAKGFDLQLTNNFNAICCDFFAVTSLKLQLGREVQGHTYKP